MIAKIGSWIQRAYDWCYLRYYRLNREDARVGNLLLVHRVRHSGEDVSLNCGTPILRGDPIAVIHLSKPRTREEQARSGKNGFAGVNLRRDFEDSLRLLAERMERDPAYACVRAIRGDAIFGRTIMESIGFDVREHPDAGTLLNRLQLKHAQEMIVWARESRSGPQREVYIRNLKMWAYWLSRESLLKRYSPQTV